MNTEKRIWRLAATFPTLHTRMRDAAPGEIVPALKQCSVSNAGDGAKQAALFCLWVWDAHTYSFDLYNAWGYWDSEHRDAWSKWATEPFWL